MGKPFGLPGTSDGASFLLVCRYNERRLIPALISTRNTIKLREPPKARKMTTKKCCSCEEIKDVSEFTKRTASHDGLLARCKPCDKAYKTAYNTENPDKKKAWDKKYKNANSEKVAERQKRWYQDNWDNQKAYRIANAVRIKAYNEAYKARKNALITERRKNDINFKISYNLRTRFHSFISTKGRKTFDALGLPCDMFLCWIEYQFTEGMTWDNYATDWHLDHVLPVSKFNLENDTDQTICFNWTNFQPLWKGENQSKFNHIDLIDFFNCFISAHRFIEAEELGSQEYQTLTERLRWLRATISDTVKSSWMREPVKTGLEMGNPQPSP
jgi:hypothetical protein